MSDVAQLLERMAETEAPAPPPSLSVEVHRSVNRSLIVQQLLDFALRIVPLAMLEFARATGALLWYSFAGAFPRARNTDGREGKEFE